MRFNPHSDLAGKHAFLSASQYHWLRYTDEKLDHRFSTVMDAARGTALHEFAQQAIKLRIPMLDNGATLNTYINDCIGFRMQTEVLLSYSENAFGTADACKFKDDFLQIFDLKNGVNKANMDQLKIYAAFFCLEYGFKPALIRIELRIYQNDEVLTVEPETDDITHIMDKIVTFDQRVELMKREAYR